MSLGTFGFRVLILTTGVQYTWEELVATTAKKVSLKAHLTYKHVCLGISENECPERPQKLKNNNKNTTLPFLAGDSILLNINVSPRLAKEAA